jgi:hypothetical protein
MADPKTIEAMLDEQRKFPPTAEFGRRATIQDDAVYREAAKDLEGFWARLAGEKLEWIRKWDKTLEWNPPWAKWFIGGKLNVSWPRATVTASRTAGSVRTTTSGSSPMRIFTARCRSSPTS